MDAIKSKKQNYVPIKKKIVISKLCTKHNFFYNLEYKLELKFQFEYRKKS